jgi:hypothetical protein
VNSDHVWRQLEALLATARRRVILVAPFIKQEMFQAALEAIPDADVDILCVTRWSVLEVAAGVSDPEIADLAARDGRVSIMLCHNLHAKLYAVDDRCLVGSANLTGKATGRGQPANLELLVEAPNEHPEIQRLLQQVNDLGVPATEVMAHDIRQQANLLAQDEHQHPIFVVGDDNDRSKVNWTPETRAPYRLYRVYSGRDRSLVDEILASAVRDLAYLDLPPGLTEDQFTKAVRVRLHEMPELRQLVSEGHLNLTELKRKFIGNGWPEERAQRAAENIGEWLSYFDEVRLVPTGPWEIRQGRSLE